MTEFEFNRLKDWSLAFRKTSCQLSICGDLCQFTMDGEIISELFLESLLVTDFFLELDKVSHIENPNYDRFKSNYLTFIQVSENYQSNTE